MSKTRYLFLGSFLVFLFLTTAGAEEILLENGDKISGKVVEETENTITLSTKAMGNVVIEKKFVKVPEEGAQVPVEEEKSPWEREISLGYSQAGGNTQESQGNFGLNVKRKTDEDEWTGKVSAFYSSSNEKMDAKNFYGMLRYARSFGEKLKWYNFYKFEGDQDRFANIYYRLVPTAGIGYWFSDLEKYKLMVELALGAEHTNYWDTTKSTTSPILVPHAFLEKELLEGLKLSQDLVLYPSLDEVGEYRLKSETALTHDVTQDVSLKVSFIDNYNSTPTGDTKKNDYRLISALQYTF